MKCETLVIFVTYQQRLATPLNHLRAASLGNGEPFALAGTWENWKRPESDVWVRTFAIIATNANELVGEIHDRMPVIIPPESNDRGVEYARS